MRKKPKPQLQIERRLAGRVELKDGQPVFVPLILKPKKKIVYLPYYANY